MNQENIKRGLKIALSAVIMAALFAISLLTLLLPSKSVNAAPSFPCPHMLVESKYEVEWAHCFLIVDGQDVGYMTPLGNTVTAGFSLPQSSLPKTFEQANYIFSVGMVATVDGSRDLPRDFVTIREAYPSSGPLRLDVTFTNATGNTCYVLALDTDSSPDSFNVAFECHGVFSTQRVQGNGKINIPEITCSYCSGNSHGPFEYWSIGDIKYTNEQLELFVVTADVSIKVNWLPFCRVFYHCNDIHSDFLMFCSGAYKGDFFPLLSETDICSNSEHDGQVITSYYSPVYPGQRFTLSEISEMRVSEDTDFYISWGLPKKYVLTFEMPNGQTTSREVPSGTIPILPTAPYVEGKIFQYWTDGQTNYQPGDILPPVISNKTYTAVYISTVLDISFSIRYIDYVTETDAGYVVAYKTETFFGHSNQKMSEFVTAKMIESFDDGGYMATFLTFEPTFALTDNPKQDVVYTAVYKDVMRYVTTGFHYWRGSEKVDTTAKVPYGSALNVPNIAPFAWDFSPPEKALENKTYNAIYPDVSLVLDSGKTVVLKYDIYTDSDYLYITENSVSSGFERVTTPMYAYKWINDDTPDVEHWAVDTNMKMIANFFRPLAGHESDFPTPFRSFYFYQFDVQRAVKGESAYIRLSSYPNATFFVTSNITDKPYEIIARYSSTTKTYKATLVILGFLEDMTDFEYGVLNKHPSYNVTVSSDWSFTYYRTPGTYEYDYKDYYEFIFSDNPKDSFTANIIFIVEREQPEDVTLIDQIKGLLEGFFSPFVAVLNFLKNSVMAVVNFFVMCATWIETNLILFLSVCGFVLILIVILVILFKRFSHGSKKGRRHK